MRRQLLPKPLRPTLMLHQDSPKLLLRTSLRMIKLMRKQKPTIRTKRKNRKETNPWKMKSQPPKWKWFHKMTKITMAKESQPLPRSKPKTRSLMPTKLKRTRLRQVLKKKNPVTLMPLKTNSKTKETMPKLQVMKEKTSCQSLSLSTSKSLKMNKTRPMRKLKLIKSQFKKMATSQRKLLQRLPTPPTKNQKPTTKNSKRVERPRRSQLRRPKSHQISNPKIKRREKRKNKKRHRNQ